MDVEDNFLFIHGQPSVKEINLKIIKCRLHHNLILYRLTTLRLGLLKYQNLSTWHTVSSYKIITLILR